MSSFHNIFIRGYKGEKFFLNSLFLPLTSPAAASQVGFHMISRWGNIPDQECEQPEGQINNLLSAQNRMTVMNPSNSALIVDGSGENDSWCTERWLGKGLWNGGSSWVLSYPGRGLKKLGWSYSKCRRSWPKVVHYELLLHSPLILQKAQKVFLWVLWFGVFSECLDILHAWGETWKAEVVSGAVHPMGEKGEREMSLCSAQSTGLTGQKLHGIKILLKGCPCLVLSVTH